MHCIVLRDCISYTNMVKSMKKPLPPSVVGFLRSQECGFDHGYPMVCCSTLVSKNLKPGRRRHVNKLIVDVAPSFTTPLTVMTRKPVTKNLPFLSNGVYSNRDPINKAFMLDNLDCWFYCYWNKIELFLTKKIIKIYSMNKLLNNCFSKLGSINLSVADCLLWEVFFRWNATFQENIAKWCHTYFVSLFCCLFALYSSSPLHFYCYTFIDLIFIMILRFN